MALLFGQETFEGGSLPASFDSQASSATSVTAIDATSKVQGTYSAKITMSGTGLGQYLQKNLGSGYTELYYQFKLHIPPAFAFDTATAVVLLSVHNSGGTQAFELKIEDYGSSSPELVLQGATPGYIDTGESLSVDTTHVIELYYKTNGTTGAWSVWVNNDTAGSPSASATGLNTGTTQMQIVRFGGYYTDGTITDALYVDDFSVSSSFIGAGPSTMTDTQTVDARIANSVTKTQSINARVLGQLTKTQTATASITSTSSTLQTATARITTSANLMKHYDYKMYDGSTYLGLLPNVVSQYTVPHEINTVGSSIEIKVGLSVDTARLASTSTIETEDGNPLETESGETLTTEGAVNLVALGVTTQSLIRNANKIKIIEYSSFHPNGIQVFSGEIQAWRATVGTQEDVIKISAYSDGYDMSDHLVSGSPYVLDVSHTSEDSTIEIHNSYYGSGIYNYVGQTWLTGSGVENTGAINLLLDGTADVTIKLFSSVPSNPTSGTPIGSTTVHVETSGQEEVQIGFADIVTVTEATTYFFAVTVASGQKISIGYNESNTYSDGVMYVAQYAGGGGGGWTTTPTGTILSASDLYFKTYRNAGETTAVFSTQDPSTGIAATIMDNYASEGGNIVYTASSIESTGLSVPYTFNTQTVREGIDTALSLSPSDFYYYVDLGTNTLNFKEVSATADYIVTKGKEIASLDIGASIENLSNKLFFIGGDAGSGLNVFKTYSDSTSIGYYGQRLGIRSDGRVTLDSTANAIGDRFIADNKDEKYETAITIAAYITDITQFKPGMTIGFRGFGTFIDTMVLKIVRLMYQPHGVDLMLGNLPPRLSVAVEQINRDLLALQSVDNPTSPS